MIDIGYGVQEKHNKSPSASLVHSGPPSDLIQLILKLDKAGSEHREKQVLPTPNSIQEYPLCFISTHAKFKPGGGERKKRYSKATSTTECGMCTERRLAGEQSVCCFFADGKKSLTFFYPH